MSEGAQAPAGGREGWSWGGGIGACVALKAWGALMGTRSHAERRIRASIFFGGRPYAIFEEGNFFRRAALGQPPLLSSLAVDRDFEQTDNLFHARLSFAGADTSWIVLDRLAREDQVLRMVAFSHCHRKFSGCVLKTAAIVPSDRYFADARLGNAESVVRDLPHSIFHLPHSFGVCHIDSPKRVIGHGGGT